MPSISDSKGKAEPVKYKLYQSLTIGFVLLFLGGAMSIPFVYESQTLWYKLGIEKTILRGGQILGLLAATLLFIQVLIAARGRFLKKLFGVAGLMRWHRAIGLTVPFLAVGHALLVLAPEGLTNLPIGKKYWPEMVGLLLLLVVLLMSISSRLREKWRLDYKKWRVVHKIFGYPVIVLIVVHVLFVSDSFEHPVPKVALITTFLGVLILVILSKIVTRPTKL